MKRALIPFILALLVPLAALADGPETDDAWGPSFRPLAFNQAAAAINERYSGRLVAAAIGPPTPEEHDRGIELVYEFRLLTERRNILDIRMDARTGRFIAVSGQGQIEARKPPAER